jgi:hypothetical protein
MTTEYVVYDEMIDTIDAASVLIDEKCDKPFEYVAKKYDYSSYKNSYAPYNFKRYSPKAKNPTEQYYDNLLDDPYYKDEVLAEEAKKDKELELEVVIYGVTMSEEILYTYGQTKAECWMNFFLDHPDICFNEVVDYSFS